MAFPSVVLIVVGILALWWAMGRLGILPSEKTSAGDG